jgi:hypothetical protein
MDQEERKELWKHDTDVLYRSIGEFVVTFEHGCLAIQKCIIALFNNSGLKNQKVTHIVLAGLTAEPLRTLFESLVGELVQIGESERKIIRNAVNRFQTLTQRRNDIIHSTWFIGYGNEGTTDFSEASGVKYHKDKSGAAVKSFRHTAENFSELTSEAQALAQIFERINMCLAFSLSVENNFVVSDQGHVSVKT